MSKESVHGISSAEPSTRLGTRKGERHQHPVCQYTYPHSHGGIETLRPLIKSIDQNLQYIHRTLDNLAFLPGPGLCAHLLPANLLIPLQRPSAIQNRPSPAVTSPRSTIPRHRDRSIQGQCPLPCWFDSGDRRTAGKDEHEHSAVPTGQRE